MTNDNDQRNPPNDQGRPPSDQARSSSDQGKAYWKANLRVLTTILIIWFVVSYGFGILLVDVLNNIRFGGFQLGFWFAQQGAIYAFLILIFYYAWRMNKIDRDFDVHEE